MSDRPTKRQEEVMINIILQDQHYNCHRRRDPFHKGSSRYGEPVPAWGRPDPHYRSRSMGGAIARMIKAMADEGWLPTFGRYNTPRTTQITAKGARWLKERFPDLPGIDEALAEAERSEAEEFAKAEAERLEREAARTARKALEREARADAMAEALRDYQITHNLTRDQLTELFARIIRVDLSI